MIDCSSTRQGPSDLTEIGDTREVSSVHRRRVPALFVRKTNAPSLTRQLSSGSTLPGSIDTLRRRVSGPYQVLLTSVAISFAAALSRSRAPFPHGRFRSVSIGYHFVSRSLYSVHGDRCDSSPSKSLYRGASERPLALRQLSSQLALTAGRHVRHVPVPDAGRFCVQLEGL